MNLGMNLNVMSVQRHHGVTAALLAVVLWAAAAPAWGARDVMLVLDNSGSMRPNDPSRLAVSAVQEFIKAQPFDTRIGIVLFSDAAALAVPLTLVDDESVTALLKGLAKLDYTGKWTQTAGAVERAMYELRLQGRPEARRAIVLVTDGLIDTGDARRDAELKAWLSTNLAQQAQRERVRIFGIAFTERADYQLLQSLAVATGAEYFRVLQPHDLSPALQRIEATLSATEQVVAEPAQKPAVAETAAETPPAPESLAPGAEGADEPAQPVNWLWPVLLLIAAALLALAWRRRGSADETRPGVPAAEPEPPGPHAVLVDLAYPTGPRRYEISHRPVVIGRKAGSDPAQDYVVVPDKTVGRWHATVLRKGQSFTIRDENSVNGTFVNNERIQGEHPLKHSDIVRVHGHTFEFLIPDLANSEATIMLPGR